MSHGLNGFNGFNRICVNPCLCAAKLYHRKRIRPMRIENFRRSRHFPLPPRPSIAPVSVPIFQAPETAARTNRSASPAVLRESLPLPLAESPTPGGCASRSRINSRVSNRAFRTGSGRFKTRTYLSQRQTDFMRCQIARSHARADLLQHSRQDERQRFDRRDFIIEIHRFHEPQWHPHVARSAAPPHLERVCEV